jgi:hypothetical protein
MFPTGGFNPMQMAGLSGLPNPFASGGYSNEHQLQHHNKEMMKWFEKCLVTIVEEGEGEFLEALNKKIGQIEEAEQSWMRRHAREVYEVDYPDHHKKHHKKKHYYEEEDEDEDISQFWLELEELETKSKKIPGFNIRAHLKNEYSNLNDEELRVVTHLFDKGGLHKLAKEAGMSTREFLEIISEAAEKIDCD